MNDNTELLTWAVQNITEWNDDYTHLRSDMSEAPLFYTDNGEWQIDEDKTWVGKNGVDYVDIDEGSLGKTYPQVITKQEWLAVKLREQFGRDIVFVETPSKTSCKPQEGHIHAKLMAEYAEVAKTNPEPWREFEWFDGHSEDGVWKVMDRNPLWSVITLYRRKPSPPKTMNIGGIEVEAWPVSEPEIGVEYFEVIKHYGKFGSLPVEAWRFAEGTFQDRVLKAGYIFSTEQQAHAVADALNKLYNDALVGWESK